MANTAKLTCIDIRILLQVREQALYRLTDLHQCPVFPALLLPRKNQNFICQDILVGYADIGFILILFIRRQVRFVRTGRYIDFQNGFPVYFPAGSLERDFRLSVHFRCSLNHIILFLTVDTGDIPVVFHPNQQPTAIGIGKSRQGAGNLLTVAHFELKIELLMLALFNQCFYRMFLLHFGSLFDLQN